MNCNFRNNTSHPVCKLGFYGGMPSFKTCEKCIDNKENNEEFAEEINKRSEKSHPLTAPKISGCCDSAKNYT